MDTWTKKLKQKTDLLSSVFLACKLYFAHTTSTDGFPENPFTGLGRNGSSRCPLLGTGGTSVGGGRAAIVHRSSTSHIAAVVGVAGAYAGTAMDTL